MFIPGRGLVVVQTLGAGDVLGWSWLVPPYRWHFGAAAIEPGDRHRLDTEELRALAEADPGFRLCPVPALFEEMLHRLQATRARLLDLYRSPSRLSSAAAEPMLPVPYRVVDRAETRDSVTLRLEPARERCRRSGRASS